MPLPRDPSIDATRAFFREGYDYVGNRCRTLGSDVFATRLMLRPVVCMMGEEAARRFYDGEHFTRAGAMPPTALRLLQNKGSVQSLDGAVHRQRRALFMAMLTGDAVGRIGDAFDVCWAKSVARWRRAPTIVLHDAVARLLCDAACRWAGIALDLRSLDRRTAEMLAMIDGAGTVGPRAWFGLALRQRAERWARRTIAEARQSPSGDRPIDALAGWRNDCGELLDLVSAGVELLNLIRPTVAVARFVTFAALALHEHPRAAAWLREDVAARVLPFVQEVRRFYPFFPVIGGRVRSPFDWRDHRFRAGDWVLLGLHATNHDPRLWAEPATFLPERFVGAATMTDALISQGAGDHTRDHRCPGEWFTIELMIRALRGLLALDYAVPDQPIDVPPNRFPTLPPGGFVISLR
jgi:fatty-acid peroxygenase